jgi:hypothetical protein
MIVRRLGAALLAALLPAAALAAAPPNVYNEYAKARAASRSHATPFRGTPAFLAAYLKDPRSAYSELVEQPDDTNAVWWHDFADAVVPGATNPGAEALAALQQATGLTKARPGIDIAVTDAQAKAYRGREAAAGALKAGIDLGIFWKARDLNGRQITAAAAHAVAMQMIRDSSRATPQAEWEARGIQGDVLQRLLATSRPDTLREDDDRYLGAVLNHAIAQSEVSPTGLPTIYRVARVAAAYADARGYAGPRLCSNGTAPHPVMPTDLVTALEDHRPLCFAAATDRATHAWFRGQRRADIAGLNFNVHHHEGWQRLGHWLGAVLAITDLVTFFEGFNASVAGELVEAGTLEADAAEAAEARHFQLTCGVTAR